MIFLYLYLVRSEWHKDAFVNTTTDCSDCRALAESGVKRLAIILCQIPARHNSTAFSWSVCRENIALREFIQATS